MVAEIFEKNILIYVMFGFCGLGVFIKLLLSVIYGNLKRAADKMGNTKNRLMKTIGLKFETSYSMNKGVNNVDIFVDRFIYKHKFCGILLYTWENICGQLLLLCMLTGSLGALLAVLAECEKNVILSNLFVGIAGSAILVFVDNMVNLSMKKSVLKVNILDYLENSLMVQLDMGRALESEAGKEKLLEEDKQMQTVPASGEEKGEKLEKDVTHMYDMDKKEEKIIKDILKEYIV